MVCPMKERAGSPGENPTEYPFEPLYRPWSWILSSTSNLFLFAILFVAIYAMYRRRKSKPKREVGYRTVETKKTDVLESKGKIKALVTGGSGCLGREIVRGLIQDGRYQVYSLDLFIPDSEDRNEDIYSYIQADIGDKDSLRLALRDIEVVFHTAGIIPNFVGYTDQDFFDVIATGTENIVAVCKEVGVKRLIYTSSVAAMVSKDPSQIVEDLDETSPYPEQNQEAYGSAKVIAEKCVLGANGKDVMLTCVMRPTGLVAVSTLAMLVPKYIGDGLTKNMMIPVDTAARVHILAEQNLWSGGESSVVAGKAYIVALDSCTYRELSELVALERDGVEATSVPMWVIKLLVFFNEQMYKLTGIAPVSSGLRSDMVKYCEKNHTYSGALGRKEIGWEDKRSWKDVLRQIIKESKESKKEK